jgi:pimeloyl-ACP methyl ester carboxylesterase
MGALEQLQRTTGVVPPWIRRRIARPLMTGLVTDTAMRNGLLDAITSHAEHTIHEARRALRRFRSTGWIGDIDVPVVVIVTRRDRLVRPARQRRLASSIPDASLITVDAGHLAAFTQPGLIADAVVTACAEIASRSVPSTRRRLGRWIVRHLPRRRRRTRVFHP